MTRKVQNILGIPISAATMNEALDAVDEAIRTRSRLQIGVVNAAKVVNMQRDEFLRQDVLSSDVIFADGMSVVWASRMLRRPLPERVPGIDLMFGMLSRGKERGYRVYCLGATPEVLDGVVGRIGVDYPGVTVAGSHNGYFKAEEDEQIAREIAAAKPDILLVAMTSPKKEKFLARWSGVMGVPVCHGVGGSFDVYAGKVRRAPESWQRLGLEWFYRLVQEPRRMWKRYLVTNSLFCWLVVRELLPGRRPGPRGGNVGGS